MTIGSTRGFAAALAIACAPATAHAGPLASVAKAGWSDTRLIARGRVSVVVGENGHADGHTLLIDRHGRVRDAGPIWLPMDDDATFRLSVARFHGLRGVSDVKVDYASPRARGTVHYVIRDRDFEPLCRYADPDPSPRPPMSAGDAATAAALLALFADAEGGVAEIDVGDAHCDVTP